MFSTAGLETQPTLKHTKSKGARCSFFLRCPPCGWRTQGNGSTAPAGCIGVRGGGASRDSQGCPAPRPPCAVQCLFDFCLSSWPSLSERKGKATLKAAFSRGELEKNNHCKEAAGRAVPEVTGAAQLEQDSDVAARGQAVT